jgi:2,4-diketo-3-deoxy-L-fuconate hydrolase
MRLRAQFQITDAGGQWSKGKSCETFNTPERFLVPADEIEDLHGLGVWSFVVGEPRPNSNTKDMIFDVYELIRNLSQYLMLEPEDVIETGTPEGVALSGRFAYLRPGDTMRLDIDGIGHQEQRLVAAD